MTDRKLSNFTLRDTLDALVKLGWKEWLLCKTSSRIDMFCALDTLARRVFSKYDYMQDLSMIEPEEFRHLAINILAEMKETQRMAEEVGVSL